MANILVVEDYEELRRIVKNVLEIDQHRVTCVDNGLEGIEAIRHGAFDVVITDLIMPEMDGLKLIEWIRGNKLDLKIIAVSGGKAVIPGVYLHAAKASGADMTIEKPFGNRDLLEAVRTVLGSEKSGDASEKSGGKA